MRRFIPLHRPRRIASAVLFAWLFALFASWAHACLVQPAAPRGHHGHTVAGAAHGDVHRAGDDGTAHGSDPAQEVCASFCETEQSIVATSQPLKVDGAAGPALFLPTALAGWPALMPGRVDLRWRPLAAPPPPVAPVAIAFLRLAL